MQLEGEGCDYPHHTTPRTVLLGICDDSGFSAHDRAAFSMQNIGEQRCVCSGYAHPAAHARRMRREAESA